MDNGRFLLAVVLMIAVVVLTNVIFPPARPEQGVPADSLARPAASAETTAAPPPAPDAGSRQAIAAPDAAVPAMVGEAVEGDTVLVSSPLYTYGFSTRGGGIVVAQLDRYASLTHEGRPVQLTPPESRGLVRYRVKVGERVIDLADFAFTAPTNGVTIAEGGAPDSLRMQYADSASGMNVDLVYGFDPDSYIIEVRSRVRAPGDATPQLLIDLGPTLEYNEATHTDDERALAYTINSPERGIHTTSLRKFTTQRIENGPLAWVALKNKYFLIAALRDLTPSAMPFGGLIANPVPIDYAADMTVTLLPNADSVFAFRLFVGPQAAGELAAAGDRLEDVSPFGYKVLQPVLRPLGHAITWALLQMHSVLGVGYGWILILFGILVRVVLWPLNAKAMRSQMKNMEMQPRLKEIQTKYKSDPERLQKEMLRLYKEEGFNPMGGCLPMLIPFPVLIALFFVFQSTIEFRGVDFLWLPDLAQADPLFILPVLLGLSMFALQFLSMRATKDPNPQMKMMMYFMPIFMTVIFLRFASGLNLYYASMNLASVPQQLQIMRERKRWQEKKSG